MTIFYKGDFCYVKKSCRKCKKEKSGRDFYYNNYVYCKECFLENEKIELRKEKIEREMNKQKQWSNTDLGIENLDPSLNIRMLVSDLTGSYMITYEQAIEMYSKGHLSIYKPNTVYIKGGKNRYLKHKIIEDALYTCFYCGSFGDTVDHIIPQSEGGRWTENNLVCSCKECNLLKDNMSLEDFMVSKKRTRNNRKKEELKLKYNKHGIPIRN